jgi:WD40 repeat protein
MYSEGSFIATCGLDCKVNIWSETSVNKWEKVFTHEDKDQSSRVFLIAVNFVRFSPPSYGLRLACCTAKGNIIILSYLDGRWDNAIVKRELAHANSINCICWAPQGNDLHDNPTYPIICTASCDKTIKLFVCKEGTVLGFI